MNQKLPKTIIRRVSDNEPTQPANNSNLKASTDIIPDLIPFDPKAKVQVIAMGGLCEIGKNTWVLSCNDKIILIDGGLAFPSEDMHGVDLVFPELTYLIENQDKIAGMIITHGHEDHIGGIVNMLRSINIPIMYGPPLAVGLLEGKLKEAGLLSKSVIKRTKPRETVQLGPFAVTWLRNNHSIPDSFSLVIQSPAGRIVHSGDFKFDHTPVDGEHFDIAPLAEAGAKGVQLLISDSTNAERAGFTPSEKAVYPKIEEVFVKASKRIIITTFASQVHRIKQIMEIAQKYGKKVVILGRSMLNIALVSRQLGYMNFPDGLLIRAEEVSNYPLNKVVILTTGSQGEPLSALTRISNGSHRQISIIPGDTVIISATPIPGNERSVAATINALFARGAEVVYGREAGVHVSGHCSQEEQKILLNLIKPKFFMPAHGEYRMLVKHGKLAEEVCGMSPENIFIMENGDVLQISSEGAAVVGEVPAGIVMVDSSRQGTVDKELVKDRELLSKSGIVNLIFAIHNDKILTGPDVLFKGIVFSDVEESREFAQKIKEQTITYFNQEANKSNLDEVKAKLEKIISDEFKLIKQDPAVQITILEAALV
ncbi:MAG: ribonuclease J [Candidatus Caenarcaniphilales bacterium]|nr:ribonuclease J [Candidatus Caenarcaniphilales bacterium]